MKPQTQETITYPNFKHVYQIYYDDESRKHCYEHFKKYHNPKLTPFFENSVIKTILESSAFSVIDPSEWVAILSPKFFSKARGNKHVSPLPLHNVLDREDLHAIGFNLKSNQPYLLKKANNIHPHFIDIMEMLLDKAGIEYDVNQQTRGIGKKHGYVIRANVYSNYIFARKWVWEKYANDFFLPMYEAMESAEGELKRLLWLDSGYSKKHKLRNRLMDQIGVPYYPYHTFICERFWTMFLNINPNINFTHYGF